MASTTSPPDNPAKCALAVTTTELSGGSWGNRRASIHSLPMELLGKICDDLSIADLKALRYLSCAVISASATMALFETIAISPLMADREVFNNILDTPTLIPFVRTVVWYELDPNRVDFEPNSGGQTDDIDDITQGVRSALRRAFWLPPVEAPQCSPVFRAFTLELRAKLRSLPNLKRIVTQPMRSGRVVLKNDNCYPLTGLSLLMGRPIPARGGFFLNSQLLMDLCAKKFSYSACAIYPMTMYFPSTIETKISKLLLVDQHIAETRSIHLKFGYTLKVPSRVPA